MGIRSLIVGNEADLKVRGNSMRKTLHVLALALVFVLAFAGVASAKVTNGYVSWDDAKLNLDGTASTPHIGYTVNTEKCAVCHAVHNAPVAGTAWTGTNPWTARTGEESQMLLRSSVANACVYCHITTNVGGVQLYGGVESNWTGPTGLAENAAHNRTSANCVNCHAVHGATTYQGPAASKILKYDAAAIQDEVLGATTDYTLNGGLYATAADARADTGARGKNYQVTVFCTQCHQNFSRSSETTLNTDGDFVYGDATYVDGDPTANKQYKSHPMKAVETSFVANGATFGGTVAWKASTTCRDCHDAGFTDQAAGVTDNNFPHYTNGAYSFVLSGANSGSVATTNTLDRGTDGMCLKCHAQNASVGVGSTF